MWAVQRRLSYQLTHHKKNTTCQDWNLRTTVKYRPVGCKRQTPSISGHLRQRSSWAAGRLPFQYGTLVGNFGNFLNTLNAFTTLRAQMKEDDCSSCWEMTRKKKQTQKYPEMRVLPSSVLDTLTIPVIVTTSPGTQLSTRSWTSSHSIVRGIRPASRWSSDMSSWTLQYMW